MYISEKNTVTVIVNQKKNVCITKRGLNMYDLDVGIQMKLDL